MTLFDASIRITDDGFLRPRAEIARDFIDPNRFHHVPVDGLAVTVQFVRASVRLESSEPTDHLVLWVHHPRMDDAVLARIASAISSAFPDTPATFVREVTLTYLAERVDVDIQASSTREHAARQGIAAVCAAACWGTLAEIERITVRLDNVAYVVRMRAEASVWRAMVSSPCDSQE